MASPIYFFTRSGCAWCKKMEPSIKEINKTLQKEQKMSFNKKRSQVRHIQGLLMVMIQLMES